MNLAVDVEYQIRRKSLWPSYVLKKHPQIIVAVRQEMKREALMKYAGNKPSFCVF